MGRTREPRVGDSPLPELPGGRGARRSTRLTGSLTCRAFWILLRAVEGRETAGIAGQLFLPSGGAQEPAQLFIERAASQQRSAIRAACAESPSGTVECRDRVLSQTGNYERVRGAIPR